MRMPQSRHKPVIAEDFDSRLEWGFGIFHSCESCDEIQVLEIANLNVKLYLANEFIQYPSLSFLPLVYSGRGAFRCPDEF